MVKVSPTTPYDIFYRTYHSPKSPNVITNIRLPTYAVSLIYNMEFGPRLCLSCNVTGDQPVGNGEGNSSNGRGGG